MEQRDSGRYLSSWEHLRDELRHLDLLISFRVAQQRPARPADPLEHLRGLVVSEDEVAALLRDGADDRQPPAPLADDVAGAARRLRAQIDDRRVRSAELSLTLPHIAHLFQLNRFEEQCLLICLAVEVDRKYEKLYAYLQDDVTRKRPTVGLIFDLLCLSPEERLAARAAFCSEAPLLHHGLLRAIDHGPDAPQSILSRSLKLDDRIAEFLLGFQSIDVQLEHGARFVPADDLASEVPIPSALTQRLRELLVASLDAAGSGPPQIVVHVHGPPGSGRRRLAAVAAQTLGLPLLVGDAARLCADPTAVRERFHLLAREAALHPAVLCVENFDVVLADDGERATSLGYLLDAVEDLSRITFLSGDQPWHPNARLKTSRFLRFELSVPDETTRAALWASYGRDHGGIDTSALGSNFRFTPGQIRDVFRRAADLAHWRSPAAERITVADLHQACRMQANPKLLGLTCKIAAGAKWEELVLPPDSRAQLAEICDQARYRHTVLGEWGFGHKLAQGKGLSILFVGPPGTGKTMAAGIVAGELGLDLYRIDLSQVVSKYIGETEKNLDRIFRAACDGNAILFFDEADALFGKRSEVRDSHDRYANVEISYLLQKMEEYEGISILATNLQKHMDEAFLRRLQGVVEFPFPDAELRERIWGVIFPKETPLAEDFDAKVLARDVKLAGGNIKNIAMAAAFYAAADGRVVRLSHILRATRREYQKLGRNWTACSSGTAAGAAS